MTPQLTFMLAVGLNIIGATLLGVVLCVVLWQSRHTRVNRLLALYIGVCLIWSITALTGRFVMTSTLIEDANSNQSLLFNLVFTVLVTLAGNSPFFFAFAVEYAGLWQRRRWRVAMLIAFAMNVVVVLLLRFAPHTLIAEYGITSAGMISIEPQEQALPILGMTYFFWYGASIYLLKRYRWPQSKWPIIGAVSIASGLLIEVVSPISEVLPLAIVATGIGSLAFGYAILRDAIFDPLRQSNLNLQKTQEELQQIISSIPGAVMITVDQGEIAWANEYACSVLEISHAELLQSNISRFNADPHDHEAIIRTLIKMGRVNDHMFQYKRPNGVIRWARIHLIPMPMKYEGKPAILSTVYDIHEQRLAQESLQQMQKFESLAVLAGGVAHDFNNLLVAILGQSSIAKVKLAEDHGAYRHVEKVETAARKAAALTHQMLAYSGRGTFSIRPININSVILDNLSLFDVTTPKHVALNNQLDDTLPQIIADPVQIQQIIMNLIINAVEAIGTDAGTITIETDTIINPELNNGHWLHKLDGASTGEYVALCVADTGCGISADKLNQIFDPFYTTKELGSGLGLAAVVGIVHAHKGALQVTSEVGEGTQFQILLPVTPILAEPEAAPKELEPQL